MRIVLAGLAGAVAMFVWTAIAHMATPLGAIGFGRMPGEQPVLTQMRQSIGDRGGLYFFPWVDMNDPKAMEKSAALEKTGPSGILLYRAAGRGMGADMTPMLIKEFLKQFVQALIWAWIASMLALGLTLRAGAVAAMSVTTAIATNLSYWNWYGFPLDYTMAQIVIEVGSGIVAGLAISAVLRNRAAT
jgi:hypothetical protein